MYRKQKSIKTSDKVKKIRFEIQIQFYDCTFLMLLHWRRTATISCNWRDEKKCAIAEFVLLVQTILSKSFTIHDSVGDDKRTVQEAHQEMS